VMTLWSTYWTISGSSISKGMLSNVTVAICTLLLFAPNKVQV
jgi:hypothetical protein